jgi:regulatory protein
MARQTRSGGTTLPPDPTLTHLPADIADDRDADPESGARGICLKLLAVRAHSRSELAAALAARGIVPEVAAKVLDRYTEVGLVDDAAFAALYSESRQSERGLAAREISRQLRDKGVDDTIVREAVERIDPEMERQAAYALVRRKLRSMSRLQDEVKLRRLVGMLARKGYSSSLAYPVCRDAIRDATESGRRDDEPESFDVSPVDLDD